MARQPNTQDISGGLSRSTYYYLRELFVLFWPMQACMLPWWTQPPRPQDVGSLAKSAEPHSRILSFCKAPLVTGAAPAGCSHHKSCNLFGSPRLICFPLQEVSTRKKSVAAPAHRTPGHGCPKHQGAPVTYNGEQHQPGVASTASCKLPARASHKRRPTTVLKHGPAIVRACC